MGTLPADLSGRDNPDCLDLYGAYWWSFLSRASAAIAFESFSSIVEQFLCRRDRFCDFPLTTHCRLRTNRIHRVRAKRLSYYRGLASVSCSTYLNGFDQYIWWVPVLVH